MDAEASTCTSAGGGDQTVVTCRAIVALCRCLETQPPLRHHSPSADPVQPRQLQARHRRHLAIPQLRPGHLCLVLPPLQPAQCHRFSERSLPHHPCLVQRPHLRNPFLELRPAAQRRRRYSAVLMLPHPRRRFSVQPLRHPSQAQQHPPSSAQVRVTALMLIRCVLHGCCWRVCHAASCAEQPHWVLIDHLSLLPSCCLERKRTAHGSASKTAIVLLF